MATVRHNEAQHRYELDTEHGLAIAVYHRQGDGLVFTHTEVPPADEGKGIGAQLVRAALDDTRKRGFKIVPACSFVVAFVRRHPEYDDAPRDGPRQGT
jgi:predicted GNAT family acetyltransferase